VGGEHASQFEEGLGKDELINDVANFEGQPDHEHILQKQPSPSRRIHSRVEARGGVYVYWRSSGYEDIAPVRNLSMGGLFIETHTPKVPGIPAKLYSLAQEGQIRADAVIRHAKPGRGLGLRFTAVRNEDRPRLAELMKRLRRSS
jgi:PilZ domain